MAHYDLILCYKMSSSYTPYYVKNIEQSKGHQLITIPEPGIV